MPSKYNLLLAFALIALASSCVFASDPDPLQDFCVADDDSKVFVNGFVCKDPDQVKAEDFFFDGFAKAGYTVNNLGSKVTLANVEKIRGLNTLGISMEKFWYPAAAHTAAAKIFPISMARIDFAPNGVNPQHYHPRASEILTVLEGELYAGFVTSNINNVGNKLFTKTLKKGDVFVFPQGLIYFQLNRGYGNAVAIAALRSQNPGVVTIANAVFGSKPPISDDLLAKAFKGGQEDRSLAASPVLDGQQLMMIDHTSTFYIN